MITGVIVGLVAGVILGVVVGLLVRADQVTAARTAEARLADASALNRTLTADLEGLRAEVVEQHERLIGLRADAARLDHRARARAPWRPPSGPPASPRPASS